jgi:hypothetical protein
MKKLIILALLVPSLAFAESTYFETGNTLFAKLESGNAVERMVALGYVKGIADAHSGHNICAPVSVTAGQVNDMVYQYLRIYPENRSYTANSLVLYVLSSAWPCKGTM